MFDISLPVRVAFSFRIWSSAIALAAVLVALLGPSWADDNENTSAPAAAAAAASAQPPCQP